MVKPERRETFSRMAGERTARVVVVGGGKIGLPLACMFAQNGAHVTVCDINPDLVQAINAGEDPHKEPEQDRYVRDGVASGRLCASTDTTGSVRDADAIVVIVTALLTPERDIDYGNLLAATAALAKGLKRGAIVSYETTLPVGGCRNVLGPALEAGSGMTCGEDFHLVFSPERVKSRRIFERMLDTPKIVGGYDDVAAEAGSAFYRQYLGAPVVNVGSLEAAEFVKLSGMIYRDVNIALANELAHYAEIVGLDIWPLIEATNTDGETNMLLPGIGVSGHCTPVYPYFLINAAKRLGLSQEFATLARRINENQPDRMVGRLDDALGGLSGKRVHILGHAFRPEVAEDAMTLSYPIRDALKHRGATVTIEDPLFDAEALAKRGFTPGSANEQGVDAIILNTAHPEYAEPDFAVWARNGVKAVVDGRNHWRRDRVAAAGLIYLGIGVI
jgi:nucleotide sugar dehydrogenase